jgi:hypothetical protein
MKLRQARELLTHGDYVSAEQALMMLSEAYPAEEAGRSALLSLAALKLDARNPTRNLDAGARILARYLQLPDSLSSGRETAEAMYLMALDLGAAVPAPDSASAAAVERVTTTGIAAAPVALPELPGPPLVARIPELENQLEEERATAADRIKQLESTVAERDRQIAAQAKELAAKEQELRRIRRVLHP